MSKKNKNEVQTGVVVTINGYKRTSAENFKALNVNWVRYENKDGSSGYASIDEWREWLNEGTVVYPDD